MRVSSAMIFDSGVASMQRQSAELLHTQQQVASGRRMIVPSDDPVAAARALELEQSSALNTTFQGNQKFANETLGFADATLASVGDLLQNVRALAVQGGNATLSDRDRASLATELRGSFDQLLGLANSTDSSGQYQYSGYMGSTRPFAGNVDAIAASAVAEISYAGDDGQRLMQVSSSRQLAVSNSGRDVFMRIPSGNGSFATAAANANVGTGTIDRGSVVNPALWQAAGIPSTGLTIVFDIVGGSTTYDIRDAATNTSLLAAPIAYVPGQAIALAKTTAPPADYGAQVVITGQPASGDTFAVKPSTDRSLFKTLADLIVALEAPVPATSGNAALTNKLGSALGDLDQGLDNILRVRASLGARMGELETLGTSGAELDVQYQESLSRLRDVDYAEAITRLTQQRAYLEAAQQSFMKVSGLSLFNFV